MKVIVINFCLALQLGGAELPACTLKASSPAQCAQSSEDSPPADDGPEDVPSTKPKTWKNRPNLPEDNPDCKLPNNKRIGNKMPSKHPL